MTKTAIKPIRTMVEQAVEKSLEAPIFDLVNGEVRSLLKDEALAARLKAAIRKQIEATIESFLRSNGGTSAPR
jgi:hypothetical protein